MMMKKSIAVIVSFALVISAGVSGVFAAESTPAFSDTAGLLLIWRKNRCSADFLTERSDRIKRLPELRHAR